MDKEYIYNFVLTDFCSFKKIKNKRAEYSLKDAELLESCKLSFKKKKIN